VRITVDRDSVAAGDDADRHDYPLEVAPGTTVDEILRTLRPDVSVAGQATWLVRLGGSDGQAIAVYASGFGMHVSPAADRPVESLTPPVIHFDYWQSAPPQPLLDAIKRGEEPDRRAAIEDGWRRLFRDRLAAAQAREASSPGGLLGPSALAAVDRLGAQVLVHADDYARVAAADGSTVVFRTDHRYWIWIDPVTDDDLELSIAWFCLPARSAEPVLAAILGERWRAAHGLPAPAPPPTTIEVVEGWRSLWRWTDDAGPQEVKNWDTPERAHRYAPFARLTVEQVVAHFTAGSPM
jgi:hypothetical protein